MVQFKATPGGTENELYELCKQWIINYGTVEQVINLDNKKITIGTVSSLFSPLNTEKYLIDVLRAHFDTPI